MFEKERIEKVMMLILRSQRGDKTVTFEPVLRAFIRTERSHKTGVANQLFLVRFVSHCKVFLCHCWQQSIQHSVYLSEHRGFFQ